MLMTDNFVEKYKEEVSESSIVDGEVQKEDSPQKAELAKPEPISKPTFHESADIPLYTFDPKAVLKETQNAAVKSSTEIKYGIYTQATPSYSPSEPASKLQANPYTSRLTDVHDISALNLDECRRSEEYRGLAQEFEKEFAGDQREMEQVSKDLVTRTKKLEGFRKELQSADLDMILFRNRLMREIDDVENDMKEAYNNILVLMEDRASMKDQFCIFKMKIKKLKGFIKTFQDDIQAYSLPYPIGEMLSLTS